jgi:hypothetical protein
VLCVLFDIRKVLLSLCDWIAPFFYSPYLVHLINFSTWVRGVDRRERNDRQTRKEDRR